MSAEEFDFNPNNSAPGFAFSQLPNNDQVLGIQNINNQTLGSFNINLQAAEELANSEANLWDTPEKSLPSIITPGQITTGNSTWSTSIEQKQPDVGFYNNFASIMALSDSGMYPGSELNNHCIGIPGSLNTNNLLINFSSQQLCDMSAPSPGELFPMRNMYGSGTSQTISPANNYCFSIPIFTVLETALNFLDNRHYSKLNNSTNPTN
ncbi:hypothetical protein Ddc_15729 [Ditylenchus destructor]|nr:hypothetical protein Ddc_15729 [Ditylenchus destructor]